MGRLREERSLPKFKLNIRALMDKADNAGDCLTYTSVLNGLGYAEDKKRIAILTAGNGYIILPVEDWETIMDEMKWIIEHAKLRRRS